MSHRVEEEEMHPLTLAVQLQLLVWIGKGGKHSAGVGAGSSSEQ